MITVVPEKHYTCLIHITSAVLSLVVVTILVLGLPYANEAYVPSDYYTVGPASVIGYTYTETEPNATMDVATADVIASAIEQEEEGVEVFLHKGGKCIPKTKLTTTITAVSEKLPGIPNNRNLHKLIYETAKVESGLGHHIHSKGGLGVMQITLSTANYYMGCIKARDKKLYTQLQDLYDTGLSMKDNLLYNVPFSIGLGMVIYCDRAHKDILVAESIRDRAQIWKKHYNTYKGVGTVNGYISKNA